VLLRIFILIDEFPDFMDVCSRECVRNLYTVCFWRTEALMYYV